MSSRLASPGSLPIEHPPSRKSSSLRIEDGGYALPQLALITQSAVGKALPQCPRRRGGGGSLLAIKIATAFVALLLAIGATLWTVALT